MAAPILDRVIACRTDPVFTLSNGKIFKVVAQTEVAQDRISNIHYVLHVPSGVTLTSVKYVGSLKNKETSELVADQAAGVYYVVATMTSTELRWRMFDKVRGVINSSVAGDADDPLTLQLEA